MLDKLPIVRKKQQIQVLRLCQFHHLYLKEANHGRSQIAQICRSVEHPSSGKDENSSSNQHLRNKC
jgi:hypothetical protein